jgi:hypothetical protein
VKRMKEEEVMDFSGGRNIPNFFLGEAGKFFLWSFGLPFEKYGEVLASSSGLTNAL